MRLYTTQQFLSIMDELSSIKVNLRGLVISSPKGMTIQNLERDYSQMIGKSIPFAKLGYNKLEQFLRSLTDTLTVIILYKFIKI